MATKNTWLHQRRKRREEQKLNRLLNEGDKTKDLNEDLKMEFSVNGENSQEHNNSETTSFCTCNRATTPDVENALNKLAEVRMSSPSGTKRSFEDENAEGYYRNKKIKVGMGECKCHNYEFYLKALLVVRNENNEFSVELSWIEGTENRELLHQIMQYIKNNLKFIKH